MLRPAWPSSAQTFINCFPCLLQLLQTNFYQTPSPCTFSGNHSPLPPPLLRTDRTPATISYMLRFHWFRHTETISSSLYLTKPANVALQQAFYWELQVSCQNCRGVLIIYNVDLKHPIYIKQYKYSTDSV